ELGLTCVYVTHDQTEALAMSNQVAVMRDGKVEQVGKPRDIYEAPKTRFVADFIGTSNFIEGVVEERRGTGYLVRTEQGQLEVPSELQHAMGDAVVVSARPEHIALTTDRNGVGWSVATTAQLALLVARRPGGVTTAEAMGWFSGATALGNVAAGVMGGGIADLIGLRPSFYVLAATPLFGALLMARTATSTSGVGEAALVESPPRSPIVRSITGLPLA